MEDFVLPESPFAEEHQRTDAMLRRLRPRTDTERGVAVRLHKRRAKLTDRQRREIGKTEGDRKEVAAMYGVSVDHVSSLRRRYRRDELE